MNRKAITSGVIAVLGILLLAVSLYLGVGFYYRHGFGFGTTVNGEDVSSLTVEEANKILLSKYMYNAIEIVDKDGIGHSLDLSGVELKADYTQGLKEIKAKANPITWGKAYFNKTNHYQIEPEISVNDELLNKAIDNSELIKNSLLYGNENTVKIVKTEEEGYTIVDETKDMLHPETVKSCVKAAVLNRQASVNLMDEGCYESKNDPSLESKVLSLYKKVDDFQKFHLTYVMGDHEEVVDPSVTANWITLDENGEFLFDDEGNLILDEKAVKNYVASLAAKYDTKGRERDFKSTSGKIIHFKKEQVLYGNVLDQNAEYKQLLADIASGESNIRREPKYDTKAFAQGADDVGNTYIEINMTEQHLYYYKNGVIVQESDFVSGCTARGNGTPELFACVRNKAKNVTLIGPGYESFVYYWMGIWRGYGMHDATWRGKFGGEIYKTNGSHGCINLPLAFIKEFYPEVEVGTPLITFYEPVETDPEEIKKQEEAKKLEEERKAEEARKAEEERKRQEEQQQQQPEQQPAEQPQPEAQPEPQP